jgi:hypothetical protein
VGNSRRCRPGHSQARVLCGRSWCP